MRGLRRAALLSTVLLTIGCGRSSLLGFDDGCPAGADCSTRDLAGADGIGDGGLRDLQPGDGPGFDLPNFDLPPRDLGGDMRDGGKGDLGCRVVEDCANGVDDNCDGLVDCADPFCAGDKRCTPPGKEICNNNLDDDDDGLVDCSDPDCRTSRFCASFDLGPPDLARVDLAGADLSGIDLSTPDLGNPDLATGCDPINPDCEDPRCKSDPRCVVLACMPEIDFGVIAPMNASVTRSFDTRGATRSFTTCAIPGGTARVGQFTLTQKASVKLDFAQASGTAHVVVVARAGTLQPCDANPISCLKVGQAPTATRSFPDLQPGIYYVIVQSYPGTQGPSTVTLSTATTTTPEVCNNGIDDDKNGLIDCADPACFSAPSCIGTQCMPDLNLGALVVGDPGKSATFDTHNTANREHPVCAGTSTGNDEIVRFTLHETAGVLIQWDETGDHVWGLFAVNASGLACDATPASGCYNPAGQKAGLLAFSPKPPGEYVIIFKALSPADEGVMHITVSAYQNQQQEICSNRIDDDGNGLVDCEDPSCFGAPVCHVPICLVDEDLGDFSWGTRKQTTVDTRNGNDYYATTCAKGTGKEKVLRLRVLQPMALGFRCTDTGSNVFQLGAQLQPLDPCDAHEFNCADPAILPFGCNFAMPNIQPGTYDLIVAAFEAGDEGVVDLTLTGIQETVQENCTNGIDDDGDGFTDCNDRKCVTSPDCQQFACRPDQKLGLLALDGSAVSTVVQTSGAGVDQTNVPCVTQQGGQDAVVDFQLPAKTDLTIKWAQTGSHVLSLFTNDSDLLACDAGTRVSCSATLGMPAGTISLAGVAQGRYHLVVKADQAGNEGGVVLQLAGVPSP